MPIFNRLPAWLKPLLIWGLVLLCLALFCRYLLGFILPFLIGLILARVMEPAVELLQKRVKFPRWVSSLLLCAVLVGGVLSLLYLAAARIVAEFSALLEKIPGWLAGLPAFTETWRTRAEVWIVAAPASLQDIMRQSLDDILSGGISIPSALYQSLAKFASGVANTVPNFLLFLCAVVFSAFCISADYPNTVRSLLRPFSPKMRDRIIRIKNQITSTVGKWFFAQLLMICITFVLLLIGFTILQTGAVLLLAVVIALVDALPVLGVGMCLVPWAGYNLATGNLRLGIGLLVLFGVAVLVRGVVEPRLVGAQLGLKALPTFIAMYVGLKSIGVLGMISFPILAAVIRQLWLSFNKKEENAESDEQITDNKNRETLNVSEKIMPPKT